MSIRRGGWVGGWMAAVLAAAVGCTVTLIPSGTDNGGTTTPPAPTTIEIRIVNNTSAPLDPQIYIGAVSAGVDGLFVPANKRTNFGVGHTGVLLAGAEDTITVKCGELGLFGTQGGIFGDDLTNPTGHGKQAVLQENVSVQCGDKVEFSFQNQGTTLVTSYTVSLQG